MSYFEEDYKLRKKALCLLNVPHLFGYIVDRHYPLNNATDFSCELDENGNVLEKIPLRTFWIGRTIFSHPKVGSPGLSANELVIAVAKTEVWHKGVILVKSLLDDQHFDLQAVAVEDWQDPFLAALQSVDLVRHSDVKLLDDGGYTAYRCRVAFLSGATFGSISFNGPMYDKGVRCEDRVWMALCSAVNDLVDFYDDVELSDHMAETIFAFNR